MPNAPTPPEDFEQWETDAILAAVRRFCKTRAVPPSIGPEDLIQEGFAHWSRKRKTYLAGAGANPRTHLDRVINNRLISIQREWRAAKRGAGERTWSLERPMAGAEAGREVLLADALPAPPNRDSALVIDLEQVIASLTPRQQRVIAGLAEDLDILAIAALIDVSRDTVYEELRRIRIVCADAGLKDYLP